MADKMELDDVTKPPPLNAEEQEFKNKFLSKIGPLLVLGGVIYLAVTGGLCLSGNLNLGGKTSVESLKTFQEKLEFTFKYQILGVLWLIFGIVNVVARRAATGAINPLASNSREIYLKGQSNVLQNSFEQFTISIIAQLSMVAFIDGEYTHRAIPWVNISFLIGRIAFWLGYPTYRTFGLLLSFVPSVGMTGVAVYKLCEHLFA